MPETNRHPLFLSKSCISDKKCNNNDNNVLKFQETETMLHVYGI